MWGFCCVGWRFRCTSDVKVLLRWMMYPLHCRCEDFPIWGLCSFRDVKSSLPHVRYEVVLAPEMWSLCCSMDVKSLLLHRCEVFVAPRMWSLYCSTDVKSLLLHGCEVFVAPRLWSLCCSTDVKSSLRFFCRRTLLTSKVILAEKRLYLRLLFAVVVWTLRLLCCCDVFLCRLDGNLFVCFGSEKKEKCSQSHVVEWTFHAITKENEKESVGGAKEKNFTANE